MKVLHLSSDKSIKEIQEKNRKVILLLDKVTPIFLDETVLIDEKTQNSVIVEIKSIEYKKIKDLNFDNAIELNFTQTNDLLYSLKDHNQNEVITLIRFDFEKSV